MRGSTISVLAGGALALVAGALFDFGGASTPQGAALKGARWAEEARPPASTGAVVRRQGDEPILRSADGPDLADRRQVAPPARRLRYVTVDRDLFTSKASPFWEQGGAGIVTLNLFDDLALPVRIERSEVLGPGRYASSGEIADRPGSRVLFAQYDGALSVSVEDLTLGRFEINALDGELHQVYEIDPALVPPCAGALMPQLDADALAYYAREADSMGSAAGSEPAPVERALVPELATVDLLVAFSAELMGSGGFSEAAVRSRIDLALAEVNSDLQRSAIRARVRLTSAVAVGYAEDGSQDSALERLRRTADGHLDDLHALRRQQGADLISLVLNRHDASSVGQAYLFNSPYNYYNQAYGFSVVEYNYLTGSNTLSHELGHNLGCAHDRENASRAGAYAYSYGHRVKDLSGRTYRTIMAYSPGQRVSYFSNPNLMLPVSGQPSLGVVEGGAGEADNARTVTQSVFEVSNYRLIAAAEYQTGKLVNVSTRAVVGAGDRVLIGGFVIGGHLPKQVLVRALGPTLRSSGLADALSDPRLTLYRGSEVVAANDSWASAENAAAIQATPFPPPDAREPGILITLDPGAYTAVVEGSQGASGPALMEVYEIGESGYRLVNLSTRGYVGTGNHVMIGGFVVNGSAGKTKRILIRGLGPTLSNYRVSGALQDPALRLYGAAGELLLENDDWDLSNQQSSIQAAGLTPGNRREPAMVLDLLPGIYTAILRPFENAGGAEPGVGLIEVYEIP